MTITLYGITNCDTVKRARAWLAEHGVDYRFHDFKKDGVPDADARPLAARRRAGKRWSTAAARPGASSTTPRGAA